MEPEFSRELNQLLSWADEVAYLRVMANADTPDDADYAPQQPDRAALGQQHPHDTESPRTQGSTHREVAAARLAPGEEEVGDVGVITSYSIHYTKLYD